MLRVGLTGGLASGKSAAAAILRDLGAVVFDADTIVRELYESGGAGQAAAKELFGEAVLGPDGRVDRSRIADIVFRDPASRHALEARIHPLVIGEMTRRFREADKAGAAVAVAEASQLLEARGDANLDRVLLIVAPRKERIRRWTEKGGDPEDAERRIAAQLSPALAFDRASDVIANDGSLEQLGRRVAEIYANWTHTNNDGRRGGA
jgi:dephospho-CoA kinase